MTERSDGWARLTAAVEEYGEQWVLDSVVTRIAEGENPAHIAVSQGYPWYVLRKWMEDRPERMQAWELAKRCFADGLVYESLREVRDAGLEEVPLARLRSETYQKTAGKVSKVEWGAESAAAMAGGGGNITIVIGRVESPYRQIPEAEVVEHEPLPTPMQVVPQVEDERVL